MKKRTITAIFMLIVLAPIMIVAELFIVMKIVLGALAVVGVHELLSNNGKEYSKSVKITSYVLTVLLFVGIVGVKSGVNKLGLNNLVNPYALISILFVVFVLLVLTVFNENFNIKEMSEVLGSILYVTLGISSIVILRSIGIEFLILLFLTTMFTDIIAYLIGVKFGKNKMAPTISPKKSWEGAVSGTLIATILVGTLGLFYGYIFKGKIFNINDNKTILDSIKLFGGLNMVGKGLLIYILVFLLSITGQIGDLVASKMKRTYEIKDFGYIFPGHGGVLDRFDSAMFAGMLLTLVLSFILVL